MSGIPAFERLLQILLPSGGMVALMMEAYFDESGTDDGAPILCVAGYVFEQEAAIELIKEWVAMLEKYKVPFFHMKDVAPCKSIYKHLEKTDAHPEDGCDLMAREAYALIQKYMTIGYAVSIETKYKHLIPSYNKFEDIYSFACWQALMSIRKWATKNNYQGKVAYVFEAGHKSQKESNSIMNELFSNEFLKKAYRYNSHAFVEKKLSLAEGGAPLLQCADILAWHITKNRKDALKGKKARGDYEALVFNDKHFFHHYGEKEILKFAEHAKRADANPVLLPHDWNEVMGPIISYRFDLVRGPWRQP